MYISSLKAAKTASSLDVPGSISSVERLEVNQPLESISRTSLGSSSGTSEAGSFINSRYSLPFSRNFSDAVDIIHYLGRANQSAHRLRNFMTLHVPRTMNSPASFKLPDNVCSVGVFGPSSDVL